MIFDDFNNLFEKSSKPTCEDKDRATFPVNRALLSIGEIVGANEANLLLPRLGASTTYVFLYNTVRRDKAPYMKKLYFRGAASEEQKLISGVFNCSYRHAQQMIEILESQGLEVKQYLGINDEK